MSSRFMVPLRWHMPWWATLLAAVVALCGAGGLGATWHAALKSDLAEEGKDNLIGSCLLGAGAVALGSVFLASQVPGHLRWLRLRARGRRLGLRVTPSLRNVLEQECGGHPTFGFMASCTRSVLNGQEGHVGGFLVRVFDVGFEGLFLHKHRLTDATHYLLREVQTAVVILAAGPQLRFSLSSRPGNRERLFPSWQEDQGLVAEMAFEGNGAFPAPVAHASDFAGVRAFFTPQRQAALGDIGDLAIECAGGTLLVYPRDRLVAPDDLDTFLHEAARVARALAPDVVPCIKPPGPAYFEPKNVWRANLLPLGMPARPVPLPPRSAQMLLSLFLLPGLVFVAMGGCAVLVGSTPKDVEDGRTLLLGAALHLSVALLVVAFLTGHRYRERVRCARVLRSGNALDLAARPEMRRDLGAYSNHPLFRVPEGCTFGASWCLEGERDGHRLRLFDLSYQGTFLDRRGASRTYRAVQTVAAVDGGPDATFHIGPRDSDWEDLSPGWAAFHGLLASCDSPHCPLARVHAPNEEALAELCAPERLEALGDTGRWVVECHRGTLLVYRHNEALAPEDLGKMIEAALAMAGALAVLPFTPQKYVASPQASTANSQGIRGGGGMIDPSWGG